MRSVVIYSWIVTTLIYSIALTLFIPKSQIEAYKRSAKCRDNILATILYQSIWISAIVLPTELKLHHFIVGNVMWLFGCLLVVWARRVNPYFVSVLVKPERYITTGPYRYLSHPGYFGYSCMASGAFVAVGFVLSTLFCLLYVLLIIDRMKEENAIENQ